MTNIHKKSFSGSMQLLTRQIIVQSFNLIGGIVLARLLSVNEYGFYGIVTYLFSLIMNFGDIGFFAGMVNKQEEPSIIEYRSVFSSQAVLVLFSTSIFVMLTPWICSKYKLPSNYSLYLYLIALSFIASVGKTIPAAKLERNLDYKWLSVIEIGQSFLFNGSAIILAFFHCGPLSFCLAFLIRTLSGSILISIVQPWDFRPYFKWAIIKSYLNYGLPLQLSTFINLGKDAISPIIIGLLLGISQSGIVNMACTIAGLPTMLLFILNRLYFSAFSRALNDKITLESIFSNGIIVSNTIVAVLSMFFLIMVDPIIIHIFGPKWMASKSLFYFIWTINLTMPTMMVCLTFINAHGKSKINIFYSTVWMLITLGLGTPLIMKWGIIGFGIANCVVNFSMVMVYFKAREHTQVNIFTTLFKAWCPALIASLSLILYRFFCPQTSLVGLIAVFTVYILIAAPMYLLLYKDRLIAIKKLIYA